MRSGYITQRVRAFDIAEGMTVVDYGCGSGRFTKYFSEKVGPNGKVYAVDILEDAIQDVERLVAYNKLSNVIANLAGAYSSGLQTGVADRVCVIDTFHAIDDKSMFLSEICRITKDNGIMYIEYGHQPSKQALEAIASPNVCDIINAYSKYAVCKPRK